MSNADVLSAVAELAGSAQRVAVLTGAGMSAESGISTFRDAQTGLWSTFEPADLASPDGWARDRNLVWGWYQWRAELVRRSQPNAGHLALTEWQARTHLDIATQNVDDLHERAGSTVMSHVHGSLFDPRCTECDVHSHPEPEPVDEYADRVTPPLCPYCGGDMRPGAVWFGESLPEDQWRAAVEAVESADLVVVVGTSGVVFPFAGLPAMARSAGASVVEINPVETEISDMADLRWRTTAANGLPALVAAL
ncbi:NAD-dependent deacylase [Rhodococcus sp. G-MC3]|uniref:SIR2 family NAD-dependent protein deacylase n=1 Tax=Rhodococcus sp. G-MC3 TaxID=3046209 RepID=UPI0024B9A9D7|nr:NAD-dependent deacylase [Rhodococcus sp. G-MC3]MDJ0392858.1 NAD-dependent deacylase [Rhodococcus sp. G-MC3]